MTWILLAIVCVLVGVCISLQRSNKRYHSALTKATGRILELTVQPIAQKPLTPQAPKAQDVAKRYSGAQLRRMADHINITAPELTNSEILRESNG